MKELNKISDSSANLTHITEVARTAELVGRDLHRQARVQLPRLTVSGKDEMEAFLHEVEATVASGPRDGLIGRDGRRRRCSCS